MTFNDICSCTAIDAISSPCAARQLFDCHLQQLLATLQTTILLSSGGITLFCLYSSQLTIFCGSQKNKKIKTATIGWHVDFHDSWSNCINLSYSETHLHSGPWFYLEFCGRHSPDQRSSNCSNETGLGDTNPISEHIWTVWTDLQIWITGWTFKPPPLHESSIHRTISSAERKRFIPNSPAKMVESISRHSYRDP